MAIAVGNWGKGNIWRITTGAFPSNAYFCEAEVPGGGILIDAGLDGPAIDAELAALGRRPHRIFCTHGHFDHAGGAAYFQEKYGCEIFLHKDDARTMKTSNFLLMALKLPHRVAPAEFTFVAGGDSVEVAGQALRYLAAPGHTPGSCVIEFGGAWFTGDTLYSRGVGLSRLPGEDHELLKASLRTLWPGLTAELTVCPGHGDPASGIAVRTGNRELQAFLGLSES